MVAKFEEKNTVEDEDVAESISVENSQLEIDYDDIGNYSVSYMDSLDHSDNENENLEDPSEFVNEPMKPENENKSFKCSRCDKTFTTSFNMKKHIKTIHEGQRNYKCDSCGKSYKESGSLNFHIKTIHEGQRKYKCDSCEQPFNKLDSLKSHIKSLHEVQDADTLKMKYSRLKKKRRNCQICGDSIYSITGLRQHLKVIHKINQIYSKDVSKSDFEVENILQTRGTSQKGNREYLIKWKNLSIEESTWEPTENIVQFDLIKKFHQTDSQNAKCEGCGKQGIWSGPNWRKLFVKHKKSCLSYDCLMCSKSFRTKGKYEQHMDTHRGSGHKCENCGLICTTGVSLRRHIASNTCKNDFKCDICNTQFTTNRKYLRHLRAHKKPPNEKVPCLRCGKMLGKESLENHVKVVHEGKCQYCDFIPEESDDRSKKTIKEILKEHMESNHRNFKCDQCFLGCATKQALREHIARHHDPNYVKQYKCDECGKCFHQSNQLKHHKKNIHEEPNSNICDICGKNFSFPKSLETHIKQVHEKANMCECKLCEKTFLTTQSLRHHNKVVHEGQNKNPCHLCDKVFVAAISLRRHVQHVHEGIVRHVCKVCGKGFTQANGLQYHTKYVHEKRKDHKCSTCGRAFVEKYALQKHIMAIHHGIKYAGVPKLRDKEKFDVIYEEIRNC